MKCYCNKKNSRLQGKEKHRRQNFVESKLMTAKPINCKRFLGSKCIKIDAKGHFSYLRIQRSEQLPY